MVDYSKWKNIEISDDEDDTHPNIDTPSLFRWRHQARVEKMEQRKKDLEELDEQKKRNRQSLKEAKEKLAEAEKSNASDLEKYKKAVEDLEKAEKDLLKKEDEVKTQETKAPWNVDTISKDGFAKTVINKKTTRPKDENLTDEEREARMNTFIKENKEHLKHFGLLRKYEDSKAYLKRYPELISEDTSNYLVIWCINLEMEEKHELMSHVAHQTICMQYILELAKTFDYDPRACLDPIFSKFQSGEPEYKASFEDELRQFKERIRKRAADKLEEAMKEVEVEEREKRLGPGGLDPVEVFESLPDELKKCFESQDTQLLVDTIGKMDQEESIYHMKRCIDSGLWIPDANKEKGDAGNASTSDGS